MLSCIEKHFYCKHSKENVQMCLLITLFFFFGQAFNIRCTTLLFGTDLFTILELWASWWIASKDDGQQSSGRRADGSAGGCWYGSEGGSCSGDKIQGRAGQGEGASTGTGA